MTVNITFNSQRWLVTNLKLESRLRDPTIWKITKICISCFLALSKIFNLLFGDHRWHSQAQGLEAIQLYRDNFKNQPELREYENQILDIFNNLENPGVTKEEFLDLVINSDSPRIQRINGTTKAHFHILGNEFGANSELEGSKAKFTVESVNNFLKNIHDDTALKLYGIDATTREEIQNTVFLAEYSAKGLASIIRSAHEKGKSLLMDGGWTGRPFGHAMFYEVVPVDATTVNFRVYNLGAGSDNHGLTIEEGKYKTSCGIEWQGVQLSKLTNLSTLQALIEMKTKVQLPEEKVDTNFNETDIYSAICEALSPTKIVPIKTGDDFNTLQHSGICAWRSLQAFIYAKVSREQYKKLMLDIKLSSILELIESKWFEPASHEVRWSLAKKGLLKICRRIDRAFEKGLITEEYVAQAKLRLETVNQWVKTHKPLKVTPKTRSFVEVYRDMKHSIQKYWNSKIQVHEEPPLESVFDGTARLESKFARIETYERIAEFYVEGPETALERLTAAANIAEELWQDETADEPLNIAMIEYVGKLPLKESFWRAAVSLHPDGVDALAKQLRRLSVIAFKTSFMVAAAPAVYPERVFVQSKMISLFRLLGIIQNPVYCNLRMSNSKAFRHQNEYYKLYDANLATDVSYDCSDQDSIPQNPVFLNNYFSVGLTVEDLTASFCCASKEDDSNALLWFFRQYAPDVLRELEEKLSREHRSYRTLRDVEKNMILYSTDALPEWMQGCRDTAILESWLLHQPVAPVRNLNRADAFEFSFKREFVGRTGYVTINLKGFTSQIWVECPLLFGIHHGTGNKMPGDLNRFSLFIRPLKNLTLSKLVENAEYKLQFECGILTMEPSNEESSMSSEEFRKLALLLSNHKDRVWKVFAYFTEHPSKLSDLDYQAFFIFAFFTLNLQQQLGPHKKNNLQQVAETFIQHHYEHSFREGQIQTCVFLNRLAGILSSYYPQSQVLGCVFEKYAQLLSRQSLTADEKSIVYAGLLEYLSRQDHLNDHQCQLALKGVNYLTRREVPKKWRDPETEKRVRDFPYKHAASLRRFLGVDDEIRQDRVNDIVRDLLGRDAVWSREDGEKGCLLTTDDGASTFRPLSGRFTGLGQKVAIPGECLDDVVFQSMFPDVTFCEEIKNNVLKIITKAGDECYVTRNKGGEIVVDKKSAVDGTWSRNLSRNRLFHTSSEGASGKWKPESKFHGVLLAALGFMIDRNTPHIARLKRSWNINSDEHNKDMGMELDLRTGLIKLKDTNLVLCKPSNRMTHFEHPDHVYEWYDESRLPGKVFSANPVNINLNRFNLSFKEDETQPNRYKNLEFPGYFLKPEERLSMLGVFKEYLVFENEQGKKKLILPYYPPVKLSETESQAPLYELKKNEGPPFKAFQRYFAYDIDDNGNPRGESLEGNLYLAFVLTLAQKYKRAAKVLRSIGEKITPYNDTEKTILSYFLSVVDFTGDVSGDALALQSYALYLRLKNAHILGEVVKKEVLEKINIYSFYLRHLKNATALTLTPHEERFLCKRILCQQNLNIDRSKEIFSERLKMLEGEKTDVKPILPISHPTQAEGPRELVIRTSWTSWSDLQKAAKKPYLISRAGDHFEKHFPYFRRMAANGTQQEKDQVATVSAFMIHNKKPTVRLAGHALLYTLEHPEEYVPMQKLSDDQWSSNQQPFCDWLAEREARKVSHTPSQAMIKPLEIEPKKATTLPNTFFDFAYQMAEAIADKVSGLFHETPPAAIAASTATPQKWLQEQKMRSGESQPLETGEYDRLLKDFENITEGKMLDITEASLDDLKTTLTEGQEQNKIRLSELKASIEAKANVQSLNPIMAAIDTVQKWGGKKKVTFDEVLVSFARKNPSLLQNKNPVLDESSLRELYSAVAEYLDLATYEQQRERGLKDLKKVENTQGEQRIALIQTLGKTVTTKRSYDIADEPALLVFEYYSGKILWQKQVAGLKLFLENKGANPVLELIMGSGKSEVLLPLLALLRADGDHISTLIVPQTLFENVATNSQRIIKDAFGQTLHTLEFHRNTTFTLNTLELIQAELDHIRTEKEALIITSKSVQCLILKFIEEVHKHYSGSEKGQPFTKEIQALSRILQCLAKQGYPIIDEADSLLSILHEVSFSLGDIYSPMSHEVLFLRTIYQMLVEFPEMNLGAKPVENTNGSALTEDYYHAQYKKIFGEKIVAMFRGATKETFELDAEEANYLATLPEEFLNDFLFRSGKNQKEAQEFYDAIPHKRVKDIVSLAADQLHHLLPFTLVKNCNEDYGLDPSQGTPMAVPYAYASTPKKGSVFANAYIAMNYTFQSYLKEGVSQDQIGSDIKRLQDMAQGEMNKRGGGSDYTDTKAWKEFCAIKGDLEIPLFNINEEHFKAIVERVNSSNQSKLTYVCATAIPRMVLFSKKLTCNSINLISFFVLSAGCTGTLWNSRSMHRKLTPMPEAGTEATTIEILWKNSNSPEDVITVDSVDPHELINELHNVPHDLLIDGGGYLKELSNSEVAVAMTKKSKLPTVFYNTDGEKTITNGAQDTPLRQSKVKINKRKSYLDQSHAFGADLAQKLDAVGLVTIGRNLLLRDLFQNVWRLRGLAGAQRVKFVVNREVAAIIRQELKLGENEPILFTHILAFAIKNQAKQQGTDNYKGFAAQLWGVPQQLFLQVLFDEKLNNEQREIAYAVLEKTWIKTVALSASEQFSTIPTEVDAADDVAVQLSKCKSFIQQCYEECPFLESIKTLEDCYQEFIAIEKQIQHAPEAPSSSSSEAKNPAKYFLPPKVLAPERAGDETVDLETDIHIDTDKELQTQNLQERKGLSLGFQAGDIAKKRSAAIEQELFAQIYSHDLPVFPLDVVLDTIEPLKPYAGLFEGIDITLNMLQWPIANQATVEDIKLFGPNRFPIQTIAFDHYYNEEKASGTLIVSEFEDRKLNSIRYDRVLGFKRKGNMLTAKQLNHLVKIKFLNGDAQYTKQERRVLKRWIELSGRERMREFFEKHILSGFPLKAAVYKNSALYKYLNEK